jgi:hypothetical protein
VLNDIFPARGRDADGKEIESRQRQQIRKLWDDHHVRMEMVRLEKTLWAVPDAAFGEWVRRRYAVTLAQAMRAAVVSRQDNVAEDDLMADVLWTGPEEAELYLTELNSGGLGQVEQLWSRLLADPSRLLEGLEHALGHCPRCENTALVLGVLARRRLRPLAGAFRAVRQARDLGAMETARRRLRAGLRRSGLAPTRDKVLSLMVRILRPGSNPETDSLLAQLNALWRRRERHLGISIEQRVFAYHCVHHRKVRARLLDSLRAIGGGQEPGMPQLYALVQQFLLLDCPDSCPECLDQPNRYAAGLRPSRDLARFFIGFEGAELNVDEYPDRWPELTRAALRAQGVVRLRVSAAARGTLAKRLAMLLSEEIEVDYLLLPIRVRRVDRRGSEWILTLELRDMIHG